MTQEQGTHSTTSGPHSKSDALMLKLLDQLTSQLDLLHTSCEMYGITPPQVPYRLAFTYVYHRDEKTGAIVRQVVYVHRGTACYKIGIGRLKHSIHPVVRWYRTIVDRVPPREVTGERQDYLRVKEPVRVVDDQLLQLPPESVAKLIDWLSRLNRWARRMRIKYAKRIHRNMMRDLSSYIQRNFDTNTRGGKRA